MGTRGASGSTHVPPKITDDDLSMDIDSERLHLGGGGGDDLAASQREDPATQNTQKSSTADSAGKQDKAEVSADDAAKNTQKDSTSIAGGSAPSSATLIVDSDDEDNKLSAKLAEIKARLAATNASEAELNALRTMRDNIVSGFDTLEREKQVCKYLTV